MKDSAAFLRFLRNLRLRCFRISSNAGLSNSLAISSRRSKAARTPSACLVGCSVGCSVGSAPSFCVSIDFISSLNLSIVVPSSTDLFSDTPSSTISIASSILVPHFTSSINSVVSFSLNAFWDASL